MSTSKTGKHGHAKCAFVAVDIFTGALGGCFCCAPCTQQSCELSGHAWYGRRPWLSASAATQAAAGPAARISLSLTLPAPISLLPLPPGKKMEDLSPSSHNVDVPHVSRTDYTLLDVGDDGFVSGPRF